MGQFARAGGSTSKTSRKEKSPQHPYYLYAGAACSGCSHCCSTTSPRSSRAWCLPFFPQALTAGRFNEKRKHTVSKSTAVAHDLASQYAAQVTGDLERNMKEQERISTEIAALQEQLSALQRDHSVLLNMQQALGLTTTPARSATTPGNTTVPSPRRKAAGDSGAAKRQQGRKAASARGRTTAKKAATEQSTGKAAQPTLVELVRRHLAEQSEPRSAAEITTALGQAHPERGIKTTVVRTTLEGLVAKSQAHRAKQGTSVFYTAPDAAEPTAAAGKTQPEPVDG